MDKLERLTILIADDDMDFRELAATALSRNFRVNIIEAADGAEAWKVIETNTVDILLTDTNMPNMNGIELLQATRSLRPDIPVHVWFSGLNGSDMTAADVLELGASSVMSKTDWQKSLMPKVLQQIREMLLLAAMKLALLGTGPSKSSAPFYRLQLVT